MMVFRRILLALLMLSLPVMLSACAEMPQDPTEQAEYRQLDDPLEPLNRSIFDVNDFLDRILFKPVALGYRYVVPPFVRDRIAGVLNNMKEPVIFANNLMQGELSSAGTTIERFGINTTIGGAGMFDLATGWGMYQQTGDFGQTLGSWGIKEGPYLVIPLLGPSNFRDAIGLGVDMILSPWQYLADLGGTATENEFNFSYWGMGGIVTREQNIESLDALKEGSLDFYAQMRSVYRQYRAKQLGGEDTANMPRFDDMDY